MKDYAYKLHGNFPYILDDMLNLKKYFKDNSVEAVFAAYSLFHLPDTDLKKVLSDIYAILKENGIFLFSYRVDNKEEYSDEPYLGEQGHNVLYMNYQTNEKIQELLSPYKYVEIYEIEKIETLEGTIDSNNNITMFKILKK